MKSLLKRLGRGAIGALSATALLLGVVGTAAPAQAVTRSWSTYFAYGDNCTLYHSAGNAHYALCIQRSGGYARAIAYVQTVGAAKVSVTLRSAAGSYANSWGCTTLSMVAGQNRTCVGDWYTPTLPTHSAGASFVINGVAQSSLGVVTIRNIWGTPQEKDNWCGPGAMKASLNAMNTAGSVTQSTLALQSDTDWLGTWPSDVAHTMNFYVATHKYVSAYEDKMTSLNRIAVGTRAGRPSLLVVRPQDLPGGSGGYSRFRHWISIYGYATRGGMVERMPYFDPANARTGELDLNQFVRAADSAVPLYPHDYALVAGR